MEYRTQAILGALQGVTILAGTLLVGVAMRVMDEGLAENDFYHDHFAFPRSVADWGFFLVPVPLLWVLWTIRNERMSHDSKGSTFVSGIVLLFALLFLFGIAARKALVIFP